MSGLRWILNGVVGVADFYVPCVGRKLVHFFSQGTVVVCVAAMGIIKHWGSRFLVWLWNLLCVLNLIRLFCISRIFRLGLPPSCAHLHAGRPDNEESSLHRENDHSDGGSNPILVLFFATIFFQVYPTVIRNTAVSLQSTCSRIGTILAPQLFFLVSFRRDEFFSPPTNLCPT